MSFEPTGVVSHPLRRTAIAVAVALAAACVMVLVAGPSEVQDVVAGIRPWWLVAVAAGQAVALAGYVLAYRRALVARGGPTVSWGEAARLVVVGFGAFSVGGGFAIDRRALLGLGEPPGGAAARVVGLGALEYIVLAPVAWVCALTLLGDHTAQTPGVSIPWAIGVPAGTLLAGLGLLGRDRLAHHSGTVRDALVRALDGLRLALRLASHPWRNRAAWAGLVLYWAGEVFSLWAALQAFRAGLGFTVLVLAFATGYAATRRTIPLAGAGTTEVLMPLALHWLGVALAPAVVAVLAYRAVNLLLCVPPALAVRESIAPIVRRGYRLQPD